MALKRLYSRYWCSRDARHRVFPYDHFDLEAGVEAPITGKSGETILLSTLNNGIEEGEMKWGYCWACERTVQCFRKTQHQIRLEYQRRNNVTTRRSLREVQERARQREQKRRAS